jgi:hypothetical protein
MRGNITLMGVLIVLAAIALRRWLVSSRSSGRRCGRSVLVPAALALALLGFVGLGGAKWSYTRHNAEVARQTAQIHAELARQKAAVAHHASNAQAEIEIQQHIAQADIQQLMDEVDAPRILLASPPAPTSPPSPPPAPTVVAVLQAEAAEAAETTETDDGNESDVAVDAGVAAEAEAAVESIGGESEVEGEATSAPDATDAQTIDVAASSEAQTPASSSVEDKSEKVLEKPEAEDATSEEASESDESAEANDKEIVSAVSPTESTAGDVSKPEKPDASAVSSAENAAEEPVPPSQPLPSWVHDPTRRVGETHREVIVTDEYATEDECYQAMDIYLLLKTYERIQRLAGFPLSGRLELPTLYHGNYFVQSDGTEVNRAGSFDPTRWQYGHGNSADLVWDDPRLKTLQAMGITADYVQREIAKKEFLTTNDHSFGPMKKLYTQIEFTPAIDRELRSRWEAHERQERLAAVGAGAGGILGLLGMVYGMLKVDTWTKGYYTKRLFLGVPAAIIGLVTLVALLT